MKLNDTANEVYLHLHYYIFEKERDISFFLEALIKHLLRSSMSEEIVFVCLFIACPISRWIFLVN